MSANAEEAVERAKEMATALGDDLLSWAIIAIVVLLAVYVVLKILRGRKPRPPQPVPDLTVDVTALGNEGPPAEGPHLEYYHTPVRLAAIVLAPAGRVRGLPPVGELPDVFDSIVPGLAKVVAVHKPVYRPWPTQLSTQGFAHAFFSHAKLPGEGGKGTPWCSAAGLVKIKGQPIMAGLVLRTASATSHGQAIIASEDKWLDVFRIKTAQ